MFFEKEWQLVIAKEGNYLHTMITYLGEQGSPLSVCNHKSDGDVNRFILCCLCL
jgi:hypothetical protein